MTCLLWAPGGDEGHYACRGRSPFPSGGRVASVMWAVHICSPSAARISVLVVTITLRRISRMLVTADSHGAHLRRRSAAHNQSAAPRARRSGGPFLGCILRGRDAGRQGHHHCECGRSDYIRVASLARGGTVAVRGIRVADRLRKFRNLDAADLVGCLRVTDPTVLFMTGWHGLASVRWSPYAGGSPVSEVSVVARLISFVPIFVVPGLSALTSAAPSSAPWTWPVPDSAVRT